jgi:hypothetical protein
MKQPTAKKTQTFQQIKKTPGCKFWGKKRGHF